MPQQTLVDIASFPAWTWEPGYGWHSWRVSETPQPQWVHSKTNCGE